MIVIVISKKNNWKIINSFFSNIKRKANNTELLDEAGNSMNNPIDVTNKFCVFFSTVADKLDEISRVDFR